ncbi:hypothetical protein F2Q68_00000299 [Brassica cretica]|uniref:Uncharacterized protein n=1 Tax=Brassica cretica TaxID=69181 RepID=A0A8S9J8D8_BRACR|nr:hypothetical protein F2Q68_00000299 [Brassica cretica]KAF3514265.1 hypothetical protein F2Q69_00000375 [Brassica cretica]
MKKIQSVDVCILSQDTSNYLLLQWSLTTSLKSSNNLVETVAIRNVRVNQSDHQLMVDILIFPQGREDGRDLNSSKEDIMIVADVQRGSSLSGSHSNQES